MLTLNDGRTELWQWDTGRKLTVDADCTQVHFSNKVFGRSVDVNVVDGTAAIPDVLLQVDKELLAWAFVGTAENGYTKISKVFKVNKRNKPAGYVFTPQDQSTLGEILDRIEDLENRPSGDISEEDIQNAVKDYLDKNPVSFEEKDPTVPDWAKQSNPPSVDIPKTLPNPHKLTFTGAVTAEYDGSKEVEVKIPEGGGSGIEVTGAEVGQTIVVKAVDDNGKPTEWETAELPAGWEVINEIVTTEETSNVTISTDFDGNPFDLAEGIGFATNPNGLSGGWYMYASPSTEAYVVLEGSRYFVIEYSKLWPVIKGYTYSSGTNSTAQRASLVTAPVFNRLRFLNWSNAMMPVGTKIKLIGRRA